MISDDFAETGQSGFTPHLPEFEPDPALWERIRSGNGRRVRRRRIFWLGGISSSVTLLAVIGFTVLHGSVDSRLDSYAIKDVRIHSQRLQDELIKSRSGDLDSKLRSRLRRVDSELQTAYDQGAADDELQSLWALRNQLLESFVGPNGERTYQLTRI